MGADETVAAETAENGTRSMEKTNEIAKANGKVENDVVQEIEEYNKSGEKIEAEKMDIDPEFKVDQESKPKEGNADIGNDEKMDLDPLVKVDDESKQEEEKEENGEEAKTERIEGETISKEKDASKEEVAGQVNEDKEEIELEDNNEEKVTKSLGKRKSGGQKVNGKIEDTGKKMELEPVTPTTNRPVRARKSVDRLVASVDQDTVKEFKIEKGRGTPLMDIPNVLFKLNKKKNEEAFKMLHTIFFGRRGKAVHFKNNISQFSGFVWHENEKKQENKVREKFDKFVKEKLLEFCDVLDIPIAKNTARKEDIITKLMGFLVAPHVTTTELLSEKQKSNTGTGKRKRGVKGSSLTSGSTPSKPSAKSRRKDEDTSKSKKEMSSADTEDEVEKDEGKKAGDEDENLNPEKSEDEILKHLEGEENAEEETEKRSSKQASGKKELSEKAKSKKITVSNKSKTPPSKTPKKSSSRSDKAGDDSDAGPKMFSRKKKIEKVSKEKPSTAVKAPLKEKAGKKVAKGKDNKKEKNVQLTDDELRNAIVEVLKEVDFNTATFTDILKQLAKQFDMDLTPRKSSIKLMIQDELTKLAAEAEDEDDDAETQSTDEEVEA